MTLTANPRGLDQFAVAIAFQKGDDHFGDQTFVLVEFVMRYATYAAITVIFVMIVALVVKLMCNCDGDEAGGETSTPTENTRLLSKDQQVVVTIYGTNIEDLESGANSSSSSEDLYDGKICLICYDDTRNCFFIPCGHCVACEICARRIINQENKSCPICRGIINKVRKLHIL